MRSQKEPTWPTLSKTLFASRAKVRLLFLASNYSFWVRACANGKILGWKVSLFPRLLPFAFSSPCFFFFSFPISLLFWAFTRIHFRRKRFCEKSEDREIILKEVRVGSGTRFLMEFSGQSYMVFCVFLWPVSRNGTHLGMVWKISTSRTNSFSKLSRTIENDDVTRGIKESVPHERECGCPFRSQCVKYAGIRLACPFPRFHLQIASRANQLDWTILSHGFSKWWSTMPENKIHDRRKKKSPRVPASIDGEIRSQFSAFKITLWVAGFSSSLLQVNTFAFHRYQQPSIPQDHKKSVPCLCEK